jgi:uncharacterized membrane protein YphA (DoxX/SURF4 family)
MSIYVEIPIRGTMDELWRLTQTPELHARWDLRFTDIEYLPRLDETEPQRFLYATRIGFGLAIQGNGETAGERNVVNGERTSALQFWSDDPKSLICAGAGYWRYVPTPDGLRFFTSYDYRVRFGFVGRVFDWLIFRPLLGWATAWSFDRLRLWIEKGIDPAVALQRSLIHGLARVAIAFVWLYQGLVPKLLEQHADELAMLQQAGISATAAPQVAQLIGCCEVVFGVAMLLGFHQRWHFVVTVALMILATAAVALQSPQFLTAAFNPVSLNLLMIVLAIIGMIAARDLPTASRCLRRPHKETP